MFESIACDAKALYWNDFVSHYIEIFSRRIILLESFRVALYWNDFASHYIEIFSRRVILESFHVALYWTNFASHFIEIFRVPLYWNDFASHYIEMISRRIMLKKFTSHYIEIFCVAKFHRASRGITKSNCGVSGEGWRHQNLPIALRTRTSVMNADALS